MKKRNKKYSGPKYVALNVMTTIFGGLSGDHMAHLQRLLAANHQAMAAMVEGRGNRDTFDALAGAINIGKVMCSQGIGSEFFPEMLAAHGALVAMGVRAMKTGRFLFIGDELKAMNEGIACHDAQLENIRAIDLDRAAVEMQRAARDKSRTVSVRAEMEREAA